MGEDRRSAPHTPAATGIAVGFLLAALYFVRNQVGDGIVGIQGDFLRFVQGRSDGRFDLQKLLILSPFDPFTTLFNLAKLQQERAITVPQ